MRAVPAVMPRAHGLSAPFLAVQEEHSSRPDQEVVEVAIDLPFDVVNRKPAVRLKLAEGPCCSAFPGGTACVVFDVLRRGLSNSDEEGDRCTEP